MVQWIAVGLGFLILAAYVWVVVRQRRHRQDSQDFSG